MARKTLSSTFLDEIRKQLAYLRDPEYGYRILQVHVAGVAGPWEFGAADEFDFHEETGVLIVRDGPGDEEDQAGEDVPEYVFRIESIVATQLV